MKSKKMISKIVLATLVSSLIASNFTACSLYPKEEQMLAPPLVEAPKPIYDEVSVTKGNIENKITGTGTLVSVNQENLFFKFKGGTLKSINVKLGDKVKKGAIVAELDTDNLDSRIKQQELSDKEAQLTLEDAKAQLSEDMNNQATAQAAQDAVNAAKAQGKTPNQEAEVKAARLQDFIDQVRKSTSQVKRAEFDFERNKLALDDLQLEKQKSTLTSTLDGIVVYVDTMNAGDYANAFKTLVTVADPTKLQVKYTGDKLEVFDLGKKVDLKYNYKDYQGVVVTNPSSMPFSTNTEAKKYVQIKVDNLPKEALIGDGIDINMILEKKENVIVLSRNCIHSTNGRNYVEMLDKGLKVQRNVELGLQNATEVEIVKGINVGEKVIK